MKAMAMYDGEERESHLRIAEHEDAIFLDLGDKTWQTIKIDAAGWRVVSDSPVRFIRSSQTAAMPIPEAGGSLELLRDVINISDDSWPLLCAWMMATFNPSIPYPILILSGAQGSGKSSTCRRLVQLLDPTSPGEELGTPPKSEDDLMSTAAANHVIGYDNLSSINPTLSDSLCRLATGGAIRKRKLYTDGDSVSYSARRPLLINGITDLARRADLLSRTYLITSQVFKEVQEGTVLEKRWQHIRPLVLGALLDAVSYSIAHKDDEVGRLPRMADAAAFAIRGEAALGFPSGTIAKALDMNSEEGHVLAMDDCSIARPLIDLVENCGMWKSTYSDLLTELNRRATWDEKKSHDWPKKSRKLTIDLDRLAPSLEASGISYFHSGNHDTCCARSSRGKMLMLQLNKSDEDEYGIWDVKAV